MNQRPPGYELAQILLIFYHIIPYPLILCGFSGLYFLYPLISFDDLAHACALNVHQKCAKKSSKREGKKGRGVTRAGRVFSRGGVCGNARALRFFNMGGRVLAVALRCKLCYAVIGAAQRQAVGYTTRKGVSICDLR